MKLVLFEDTKETARKLINSIRGLLGSRATIELFNGQTTADEQTYEARLLTELANPPYNNASLIVADRDLSKIAGYGGLSEAIVRRVAFQLATPECSYARNAESDLLTTGE